VHIIQCGWCSRRSELVYPIIDAARKLGKDDAPVASDAKVGGAD
jgi:hypothetical protein